jgi:hypothetical protein
MRPTTPSTTHAVHAFVATISESDLRTLVAELVAVLLRCFGASPGSSPEVNEISPGGNGRRRSWSQARRDAQNAKRRGLRATPGNGRRRRGRKPKGERAARNGAEATTEDQGVTAQRLWEHAARLEPKAPWRAIVREFGVADAVAQQAHRDGVLPPCTPRAAARFLTL